MKLQASGDLKKIKMKNKHEIWKKQEAEQYQ